MVRARAPALRNAASPASESGEDAEGAWGANSPDRGCHEPVLLGARMPLQPINRHWEGELLQPKARVHLLRTAAPYADLGELAVACTQMCDWLKPFDRASLDLLCDMRLGPPRNDGAFERAMAPFRKRMQTGFRRVVIVVASTIGRLHIQRLAVDDGIQLVAFVDPSEADAYLSRP